jgi:hypothetical protein
VSCTGGEEEILMLLIIVEKGSIRSSFADGSGRSLKGCASASTSAKASRK